MIFLYNIFRSPILNGFVTPGAFPRVADAGASRGKIFIFRSKCVFLHIIPRKGHNQKNMDIKKELTSAAVEAIKSLYGADVKAETIQLQKTKKEYEGQITLVVFPLLRILRRKPDVAAMSLMS